MCIILAIYRIAFFDKERLYRERGPRSGPREPLTSAREGMLEVFSFRKSPENLA